jgi:hypothetical protein
VGAYWGAEIIDVKIEIIGERVRLASGAPLKRFVLLYLLRYSIHVYAQQLVCHCGGTILDPPIPCGTRINCAYQCSREPPSCGHPMSQHTCHEDPTPCPPCPFLTRKECLCGKKVLDNIKCSQEKVLCGTPCGKYVSFRPDHVIGF